MYHMFHGNGVLGWLMPIMHMAIPVLVIYILFGAINGRGDSYRNRSVTTPLDILKGRYAKGEISRDEFQRMKDEIRN